VKSKESKWRPEVFDPVTEIEIRKKLRPLIMRLIKLSESEEKSVSKNSVKGVLEDLEELTGLLKRI